MADRLVVGRLKSPNGLSGWIWMDSFTADPVSVFDWMPWYLVRRADRISGRPAIDGMEVTPKTYELRKKGFVVQIANLGNRDLVEPLINCFIEVELKHLPKLEFDEYYWRDLNGCRVFTINDVDLGWVTHVLATGSNDVLVVKSDDNTSASKDYLIPFTAGVVLMVDLKRKILRVDWDPDF